ncbi:hypothetical protein KFK09_007655 [Dendrobium nobile]|uniref:Uncharacterized protein n=1 Tax=Dendrobium nobile TaxID=94219 RepID=A0A8T3BXQ8_DENNO|nr:hypothetical protein KFK09_007655 [Dendrobium nobile]
MNLEHSGYERVQRMRARARCGTGVTLCCMRACAGASLCGMRCGLCGLQSNCGLRCIQRAYVNG